MDRKELMNYITTELTHGRNIDLEYNINGIPYIIKVLAADETKGINIPSILVIPLTDKVNNQIVVEANNLESDVLQDRLEQAGEVALRLANLTKDLPSPVVIPVLPSDEHSPYFQQLSKECFELSSEDRNYRIDEQVIRIIQNARNIIENEIKIKTDDKIFLNGYSSSGVFAQRFALLHPEKVKTVCIGGASGSIPIPTDEIGYPIGIADYEQITGKTFDKTSYLGITFRYYVGELETINKVNTRFDDNGNPAPMHDMSYFERSVPKQIGLKQREMLGQEMFIRAKNTIEFLRRMGINIEHKIVEGRTHNNKSGVGVNEIGDKIIKDTYQSTIERDNNDYIK